MKTIFMGTPDYVIPVLNSLYQHSELIGIVTAPDKVGGRGKKKITVKPKEFAIAHHIPLFQPVVLKNNLDFLEQLQLLKPDLLVVYAYGVILPKPILEIPTLAPLNLHGSLLPKYRGASPIHAVLLHGEKETGVTAQVMVEELDAGNIIHQVKTKIQPEDNYNSLNETLSHLSAQCIQNVIKLFQTEMITQIPQNRVDVTFCKKIKKEDGIILWEESYQTISQKLKAYIHWPQSYTYHKKKRVIIHDIEWNDDISDELPGTIIQANKLGLIVQCGDGTLKIKTLQPQNKKQMDFRSFLNGNHWQIGDRLTIL